MSRSRREFLWQLGVAGAVVGGGLMAPSARTSPSSSSSSSAARASSPRTLIWVELKGGNDGLNMVVPVQDAIYRRARPTLALGDKDTFAFAGGLRLHGALLPMASAVEAGDVAAVVGVGYAPANRSHFRSIQIWDQACGPDEVRDEGWLVPVLAAARRQGRLPTSSAGLAALDGVVVRGDDGPLEGGHTLHLRGEGPLLKKGRRRGASSSPASSTLSPAAAHIQAVRADLAAQSAALSAKLSSLTLPSLPSSLALPPKTQGALATAARIAILGASGDRSVPVVKLTLPGFDTHTNQAKVQARLLGELGAALAALRHQLRTAGAWDHTVVVVMSEFGRRVRENKNGGTDHGAAGPVLMMGGGVRGGLAGPSWDLDHLDDGDVKAAVSHRDVFAEVAAGAFGLSDAQLAGALPGVSGLLSRPGGLGLWRA
jgi:uncharacterized protein (DUF1501 family)